MTSTRKTLASAAILISCIAFIFVYFLRQEYQPPAEYCPFTISENENYHAPLRRGDDKGAEANDKALESFHLDILDFKRVQSGEFGYSVFIWDSKIFLLADCNIRSFSDFRLSWWSETFAKKNLLLTKISDDEYAEALHGASYK